MLSASVYSQFYFSRSSTEPRLLSSVIICTPQTFSRRPALHGTHRLSLSAVSQTANPRNDCPPDVYGPPVACRPFTSITSHKHGIPRIYRPSITALWPAVGSSVVETSVCRDPTRRPVGQLRRPVAAARR